MPMFLLPESEVDAWDDDEDVDDVDHDDDDELDEEALFMTGDYEAFSDRYKSTIRPARFSLGESPTTTWGLGSDFKPRPM